MGQVAIDTTWVDTIKNDGTVKGRLCVRGDRDRQKWDLIRDAPTVGRTALRVALTMMACNQWTPHATDVQTAFLQGEELDRVVHVRPPPERRKHGKVWRLRKAAYGLVDAPAV